VILLDTNYLIRALVKGSVEANEIIAWLHATEGLCTSTVAWYEFLCGPVDDEGIALVRSILDERILPFTADQAAESSRLYNATGRKRALRVDAMIAAAAIIGNAVLATDNTTDFSNFIPHGLRLAEAPGA
jgi:predicted nucleic acid-binding protein